MPSLYGCRSASAELRQHFGAELPPGLAWRGLVGPGRMGLVIRRRGGVRVAENMHWGLPMGEGSRRLSFMAFDPFSKWAFGPDMAHPGRCLIALDSFALPSGPRGKRTRSWFGLWDEPIFAWAGLWREVEGIGNCFLGAVTRANPLVRRAGPVMPTILRPSDYERWLSGTLNDLLPLWRRPLAAPTMWIEETDELWSSGRCLHEIEAQGPPQRCMRT